jgi:voltage-gated potassium channel
VATPGDYIFKKGDHGEDMFFIISGELEVYDESDENVITVLKEGDFFGEIALLHSTPRTASIKAINYCNLYILRSKTFKKMIEKHPEIIEQIEEKAKLRQVKHS